MARKKRPEGTRRPNGASSIYLGRDGNWHGWVTMGIRDDGKPDRRHVKRKDEGDVIEAVRELEQQRDSGKVRKAGRAWTVEKWLAHWVENIAAPSVRRNTLVGYRAAVYGHLIPGVGAHRINKLQPEHLEALYRKLATKKGKHGKVLKPATIHQAHRTVRTALGEAMRRGHITSNPAEIARPPRIPEEEIIPFTKDEAAQILRACMERRNGVRFVIALTLGLRKGEALGLQWRDVDFKARTLAVRRSLQPVKWTHGCTPDEPCGHRHAGHCPQRHGGGAIPQEVKSRAGRRTVAMPAPIVAALQEHQRNQWEEREKAGNLWHDEGWVFASPVGKPVHPRTDHGEWKALLTAAGVRNARLHDARHTAATMLLVLGVPGRAVMEVMGWSHVGMTSRYQHMTTELMTSIADQIGGLFWSENDQDDGNGGSAGQPVAV
ncbi:tyrosine-type recombinase/integrase [Amycolatopsis pithecellobii]|uniref:Tyrosine-type recombinase/integrase n=1 Tax=Amycolatopsis pithecellobii TaxID=664692 RepID=A0A6N7Z0J9_9PSEU|nr:site-specific integrase [Amycolatopsis pithecellobii]MTD57808.1 tyrosine-type recombinase/integrase [Amycolatopsis pithecellobii]